MECWPLSNPSASMEALTDPIVGIDLGTSNSAVAHANGAGPAQVLADDGGAKIHPSVVSFHPNGGVVVGAAAKQRKVIDPQNTIYSVKRLIGRGFRSPEVQTARSRVPYQIKEGANHGRTDKTRTSCNDDPHAISSPSIRNSGGDPADADNSCPCRSAPPHRG